jgi:hypothetical protein
MRGQQERTGSLFSYVSIKDRIPASHPRRRIRKLADQALDRLNPTFFILYASEGRPSVPPEQLLLASLLQAFYGCGSTACKVRNAEALARRHLAEADCCRPSMAPTDPVRTMISRPFHAGR